MLLYGDGQRIAYVKFGERLRIRVINLIQDLYIYLDCMDLGYEVKAFVIQPC